MVTSTTAGSMELTPKLWVWSTWISKIVPARTEPGKVHERVDFTRAGYAWRTDRDPRTLTFVNTGDSWADNPAVRFRYLTGTPVSSRSTRRREDLHRHPSRSEP